jgi:hypothetical protein
MRNDRGVYFWYRGYFGQRGKNTGVAFFVYKRTTQEGLFGGLSFDFWIICGFFGKNSPK